MADSPTPDGPGDDHVPGVLVPDDAPRRGLRVGLVTGAVLLLAVGWVYLLFFYRPAKQIDELSDRTFPVAAEKICAATMQKVDDLPIAAMANSPKERGATVAAANADLSAMVDELRTAQPTGDSPEDKGVREWVGDWEQHVKDRTVYADELQSGKDARFLESTKGARQLSRAIDAFAQVNKMPSCETPQDVG